MTKNLIDGVGNFPAMLLGKHESSAGVGIRIRAAADGGQGNGSGMLLLQILLGVTGPITADLVHVPAQRGAVAGVIEQNCQQFILRSLGNQDREAVIDWAAASAAIGGEGSGTLPPSQFCGPAILQSLKAGTFNGIDQVPCVTLNMVLMFWREWGAEKGGQISGQTGCCV